MTPAEHYIEAERLIDVASGHWKEASPHNGAAQWARFEIAQATAHATLAVSVRPLIVNLGDAAVTPEFIEALRSALAGVTL